MKARPAGFFMTVAQEVVRLATQYYARVALLGDPMTREKKPAGGSKYGDKTSPSLAGSSGQKPAPSTDVKGGQKKSPKVKAPVKPKPPRKPSARTPKITPPEPSPNPERRSTAAEGNTLLTNPVELSEKELQALEVAALHGLDPRQAKFCDLYLVSYNATQAYRDAGYRCKNDNAAAAGASRLLKKVKDHPYMRARQAEMFKRVADVQNQIIAVCHAASFADPRELVEYVRRCCRYCYGVGFKYQFRPSEMQRRRDEYDEALHEATEAGEELEPFDELGGLGFDSKLPPNMDCPECSGEGVGKALFKDTGNLSPAALALYEGVKEGKDGTEIRVASQKGYRELLAKIFDLQVEPVVTITPGATKEQLEEVLAKAEAKTNAQRAEMLERERFLASLGHENGAHHAQTPAE
ncbi:terminase small subunit [Pseudomonas atacamensis]|uniref:terminase small subunit n=1 Tax=Pseudomonas atacamensis TaxID=2565368 RepID=UPI0019D23014|nr:terminase small subunit [Pseudomonas atacamensis]QSL90505.1 terminase small subunit [Pseudomonas atacamensis]